MSKMIIRRRRFDIDDEDRGWTTTYYYHNPDNGECIQVDSYDAPRLNKALLIQGFKLEDVDDTPPRTNNGNEEFFMAFSRLVSKKRKFI